VSGSLGLSCLSCLCVLGIHSFLCIDSCRSVRWYRSTTHHTWSGQNSTLLAGRLFSGERTVGWSAAVCVYVCVCMCVCVCVCVCVSLFVVVVAAVGAVAAVFLVYV
jgi:peptidoglycan/LPS O-acetylase OafA/YrhL